ncbi:hypothetical protein BGZ60DRAFT_409729 [Tricladium varicosporioides]|nr:hypothetical protein BGZ60DRAFT_409729 [Hymenoscyphus varicosporioides]
MSLDLPNLYEQLSTPCLIEPQEKLKEDIELIDKLLEGRASLSEAPDSTQARDDPASTQEPEPTDTTSGGPKKSSKSGIRKYFTPGVAFLGLATAGIYFGLQWRLSAEANELSLRESCRSHPNNTFLQTLEACKIARLEGDFEISRRSMLPSDPFRVDSLTVAKLVSTLVCIAVLFIRLGAVPSLTGLYSSRFSFSAPHLDAFMPVLILCSYLVSVIWLALSAGIIYKLVTFITVLATFDVYVCFALSQEPSITTKVEQGRLLAANFIIEITSIMLAILLSGRALGRSNYGDAMALAWLAGLGYEIVVSLLLVSREWQKKRLALKRTKNEIKFIR